MHVFIVRHEAAEAFPVPPLLVPHGTECLQLLDQDDSVQPVGDVQWCVPCKISVIERQRVKRRQILRIVEKH
ncbi:hypothetical protein D3C76_1677700 [compost metagenome]